MILNNRSEIPTLSAVLHQSHLHHIAKHIPELDPEAKKLLLLSRDILRAHKVMQQVNGPHNTPFVQHLDLGWVVIEEVCLGNVHKRKRLTRPTNCTVVGIQFFNTAQVSCMSRKCSKALTGLNNTEDAGTVFNQTQHDNKPAPSVEDTSS